MKISEKYVSEHEKTKPENKDKLVLPNEFYALCESFEELINKIEELKLNG